MKQYYINKKAGGVILCKMEKFIKLWYNVRRKPYCVSLCGFTAPVRCTGCVIDSFAKMLLQASIFASWYNNLKGRKEEDIILIFENILPFFRNRSALLRSFYGIITYH